MSSARSSLEFQHRGGRTVLVSSHLELPLVVQRPLRGPDGEAVAVLLTPAGALFDGDAMRLEIRCGPQTDVTLSTASATRLNRCDVGEIRFDLYVEVGRHATFRYLPHELIPFGGTRYRQHIMIDLGGDARAWLLEVIGAGPTGAAFTYARLAFETSVHDDQVLLARERAVMTPRIADQLRGHTHVASLFALGPEWDRLSTSVVNQRLARHPPAGASLLPGGGMLARAVGDEAQMLREHLLRSVDSPDWLQRLLPP